MPNAMLRAKRWFRWRASKRRESALRDMAASPVESSHLAGAFNISDGSVTGWAENTLEPGDRDLLVAVIHDQDVIAWADVGEKAPGAGWRFDIPVGSRADPKNVLHERIRVRVRDSVGGIRTLRLTGGTELELIRRLRIGQ